METTIIKRIFLWQLIFVISISFHSDQIQASQKGAVFFAGTLASVVIVSQMRKLRSEMERDTAFGDQNKVHRYLENKFDTLQASSDINVPLVARLIFRSKGYTPPYKEYDRYIQAAYELAQLDNKQINMQHLETAVHDKYGKKMNIIRDERETKTTAIHELGHALAIIYKLHNAEVLHYVEVHDREMNMKNFGITGHNDSLPIKATMHSPEEEWRNKIIVALSGGIAPQVVRDDDSSIKNLQELLSDEGCGADVKVAYKYAEKIAMQNLFKQSYMRFIPLYTELKTEFNIFTTEERAKIKEDIDRIIAECYDEAFNFVYEHKSEIKLAVDMLLKNGSLSGDDLYDLWNFPKPLYNFEEGPLPQNLIKNYELRGYEPEAKS